MAGWLNQTKVRSPARVPVGLGVFSKLFGEQDVAGLERPRTGLRGDAARWAARCPAATKEVRTLPGVRRLERRLKRA